MPAASYAMIVTTLEPVSNGMVQVQLMVPVAVPDWPVLVDQVILVTPTLSLAVPLNAIVEALVEMEVAPGDAMVNVGGVVSTVVPGLVGVVGVVGVVVDCRVTVTV